MDVTHLTLYCQYLLRSNFYLNLHKVNVFICLNHTMLTLQYVSGKKNLLLNTIITVVLVILLDVFALNADVFLIPLTVT